MAGKRNAAPAGAPPHDPLDRCRRFISSADFGEVKKLSPVKDGSGRIVDYSGVIIEGYLSTFQSTTALDRQGDYVKPGAFADTIGPFMAKNPILLKDHNNQTGCAVGRFMEMKEDNTGLWFRAVLTEAPGEADLRVKVAEGIIKTVSMGGIFLRGEDGMGIERVHLWEGSLVPIPANPDAVFVTRSLTDYERRAIKSAGGYMPVMTTEFLRAMHDADKDCRPEIMRN